MNEPMDVELGFFAEIAAVIAAIFTTVVTVAPTAIPIIMTADSLIKSFTQPKTGATPAIPGLLGLKQMDPQLAKELEERALELEKIQQETQKAETAAALKQKTENILSKYGIYIVGGGILLGVVLLSRRKTRKIK